MPPTAAQASRLADLRAQIRSLSAQHALAETHHHNLPAPDREALRRRMRNIEAVREELMEREREVLGLWEGGGERQGWWRRWFW